MKLPLFVFIATAMVGLVMPIAAYRAGIRADIFRFEKQADETVNRIALRISQHLSLLTATRSLFEARRGNVSYLEFSSFIRHLGLSQAYDGVQGIGVAAIVPPGGGESIRAALKANYGIERAVPPVGKRLPAGTSQPVRTAVVMLEPSGGGNAKALGYDMYANEERRAAMHAAAWADDARATGKVNLIEADAGENATGFLVFMPYFSGGTGTDTGVSGFPSNLRGFIYAAFRAADLIDAAVSSIPGVDVHLRVYADSPAPEHLLFESKNQEGDFGDAFRISRTVEIAGRNWVFVSEPSASFHAGGEKAVALVFGLVVLIMAGALAASLRSQMKVLEASNEVLRVTEAAAAQKDFLLQEMKHRIKNSITRVLAIARQTARQADTLEGFTDSFTARLQAMAASQEMLTHSHRETAGLEELLRAELLQVFGEGFDNYSGNGPHVELGAQATQALALVFHELATNALKHADMAQAGNRLDITWSLGVYDGALAMDWREQGMVQDAGDQKDGGGFGTRLIHSLVTGGLSGTVERDMSDGGMHVRFKIPAKALI